MILTVLMMLINIARETPLFGAGRDSARRQAALLASSLISSAIFG